jgi:uncharacterized protein YkwD
MGSTGMQTAVVERRRPVVVIGLLLASFLFLGLVAPKHADATTTREHYMINLINKARTSHGRAALRTSDSLSNIARKWSKNMAARNRLYHNPYLATWLKDWNWTILGENVGVGTSVLSLHKAFMASPSHRANILDRRFRNIGVGIVSSGGRLWVTVIFRG